MALANEDISKPAFGDLVENSSPALNSFGQMFTTAKENFYSHAQADHESSLTFSPASTAAEENFYSREIGHDESSSSPTTSPKTILGNLFDGKRQ